MQVLPRELISEIQPDGVGVTVSVGAMLTDGEGVSTSSPNSRLTRCRVTVRLPVSGSCSITS